MRAAIAMAALCAPGVAAAQQAVEVVYDAGAVRAGPEDGAWDAVPETRLVLSPQLIQPPVGGGSVTDVGVRAAHDGSSMAWRLEWADASEDRSVQVDAFRDALALGFPLAEGVPSPFMGDEAHPVAVWQWAANLDADARGEGTFDEDYPHTEGVWHFPQDTEVHRRVSGWRGREPVQAMVAAGPGTLERVGVQGLEGQSTWADGRWQVVIRRPLSVEGDDAVAFAPGGASQLIVAVWDGVEDEVNGRKSVTMSWAPVSLEEAP